MRKITTTIFLLAGLIQATAQDIPANADQGTKNPYPFISSVLLNLYQEARSDLSAAMKRAEKSMLVKDQRIYLEFVHGSQTDTHLPIDNDLLRQLPGVELTTTFVNRSSAWVPANQLLEIGQSLPPDYRLAEVLLPVEDNQGPGVTNSDSYSGTGGSGILIAVIDSGFDSLAEARAASTAPTAANTTAYDYTGTGIQTTTPHGTGCLETIFDHAPSSLYNIYKTASASDLGTAVNQCITNGVDVISHSVSYFNTGWADNSGAACAAASNASSNGILFVNSCGNRHGEHWQGSFGDNGDGDNWHSWSSGGDEQNNFTISGSGSINIYLQWNSSSGTDHYDLYLYNSSSTLLASSTNTGDFEIITYTNPSASAVNVYIAVQRNNASPPQLELFINGNNSTNLQHFSDEGSCTSPSNSTASNAVSVGAVAYTSFSQPAGTSGILASYSSRGPTNGGSQAPDICGPTNTTTVSYPGGFTGTSCATPNVAGTAAAFWSGHTALSATGVRRILLAKAGIYKDWGDSGIDNLYGNGGAFLFDYHADNRYILSAAGNNSSAATLPYYSIEDVDNDAVVPENLRIYYLDKNATAPGTTIIINKPMLYRSLPGTTID